MQHLRTAEDWEATRLAKDVADRKRKAKRQRRAQSSDKVTSEDVLSLASADSDLVRPRKTSKSE